MVRDDWPSAWWRKIDSDATMTSVHDYDLEDIVNRMADAVTGVEVADRSYRLKKWSQCFVGENAVVVFSEPLTYWMAQLRMRSIG